MTKTSTPSVSHRRLLLALTFVAYIALGLPDALIGVAWPQMRADFDLPLSALGPLYVSATAGYVIASTMAGALLARVGLGTLLAASCALTGAALLGYVMAPSWSVIVAFGLLTGCGGGAIDAAINTHAAVHYSARLVNVLHAFWGVGAALGPALLTATLVHGYDWRYGYVVVVAFEFALALAFAMSRIQWGAPVARHAAHSQASLLQTLRSGRVQLSLLVFLLYTGCEAAAGAWAFSLLYEARDVATSAAGLAVSLYWGGLFASRLGYACLPADLHPGRVTAISIVVASAAMLLLVLDIHAVVDIFALGVLGAASGPIFPCMISMTPQRLGQQHTANAIGAQIAVAAVGFAGLPALCGVVAQHVGLNSIPVVLLACWSMLLFVHLALEKAVER
ncbi:MAG: MFS transporter [Gammaproteobacteria bacterium]|nr:MFS transporter [Gammaproteobacteria bacterium]